MNAPHHDAHVEETDTKQAAKRAAVNGLAVVGFLALVFLGIMLAIYGARFVPDTISRLTSAVYLSSEPTNEPATTTGTRPATTTVTVFVPVPATTTPVATTTPTTPTTLPPSTGGPNIVQYPTYYYNYPRTPSNYGLPDLTVEIIEVGYLRTSSASSFREDDEVPEGERGAFRFTVRNIGTNVSGLWRFRAELPTQDNDDDVYTSAWQSSLVPGASKIFTIGFDDPDEGRNRVIEIEVDYNDAITESNERNNDDSARIDVES
ncbi:hypothetical protein K2Y00_03735 [Patescibacteria group bacterium]|nr:hypothetical protein [Patescibacteria group bacterium]